MKIEIERHVQDCGFDNRKRGSSGAYMGGEDGQWDPGALLCDADRGGQWAGRGGV
jgi:hypothetical protein